MRIEPPATSLQVRLQADDTRRDSATISGGPRGPLLLLDVGRLKNLPRNLTLRLRFFQSANRVRGCVDFFATITVANNWLLRISADVTPTLLLPMQPSNRLLVTCITIFACCVCTSTPASDADHVIIPGYERFRSDKLDSLEAGRLLISELNCQSCHGSILDEVLPQRRAPILTRVSTRIQFEHLKAFIANPHGVKPGTAMPQLLSKDDADSVEALAQFLAAGAAPIPAPVSGAAIARGERLFHTAGCAACHGDQRTDPPNRPSYAMPLGPLDQKYTVGSLIGFLKDPHAVRPSGRMPSLNLDDKETRDVASYLLKNIDVEPRMMVENFEGS